MVERCWEMLGQDIGQPAGGQLPNPEGIPGQDAGPPVASMPALLARTGFARIGVPGLLRMRFAGCGAVREFFKAR